MAKGSRGRNRSASRQLRSAPYLIPSCHEAMSEDFCSRKFPAALDKKDWKDATCSVCMECPHNAVLLLCSSHDKGCRPYMCGTSFRYSNCLDQYKNAYSKSPSTNHGQPSDSVEQISGLGAIWSVEKGGEEILCPLCRGQVKGWTVVAPAREYLNGKRRSCMQDDCSFVGTFRELRKHMRAEHPSAQPRQVDPNVEQKWRRLERERDRDDVISTIRATMPGARVFGDYVIENNQEFDSDDEDEADADGAARNGGILNLDRNLVNFFLLFHAFGPSGNDLGGRSAQQGENAVGTHNTSTAIYSDEENDNVGDNNEEDDGSNSLVNRLRRHGRVLLGRSGRRRRRREANRSER